MTILIPSGGVGWLAMEKLTSYNINNRLRSVKNKQDEFHDSYTYVAQEDFGEPKTFRNVTT